MTLVEVLDRVEATRRTLQICNYEGDDAVLSPILAHVEPHGVDVVHASTPAVPDHTLRLLDGEAEIARDRVEDVYEYVTGWRWMGEQYPDRPALLAALDDSLFRSYDAARLRLAANDVERRAVRDGDGTLHVGVQQFSRVAEREQVYHRLPTRCEVCLYGRPDTSLPVDDVAVVASDAREVTRHRWTVYDGDGDDARKAAVVAAETEPGSYTGFWTYRADIVDDLLDHLEATYAPAAPERRV